MPPTHWRPLRPAVGPELQVEQPYVPRLQQRPRSKSLPAAWPPDPEQMAKPQEMSLRGATAERSTFELKQRHAVWSSPVASRPDVKAAPASERATAASRPATTQYGSPFEVQA